MAHTPGPWYVGFRESTAIVTGSAEGMVLYRGRPEFTEADARLIAAAPDLLAALRGALEYMEANSRSHPSAPVPGTYTGDRILASRVAIAKATIPHRYPGMVEMGNEVYTSPIKPRK